jgi:hypothetical protein
VLRGLPTPLVLYIYISFLPVKKNKKNKTISTTNFKLDGSDQLFRSAGNPSLFVW